MNTKKVYVHTIGCQMNVVDSELILARVRPLEYAPTDSPEKADLVIVNTCAIRKKAEQKAFSFIGRLFKLKQKKPGLIVGVGGCVAQQEGRKIMQRMPHVDLVFGTSAVDRLTSALARIEAHRCRIVDVDMMDTINEIETSPQAMPSNAVSKFITIMRGCNNFCTYCVVPFVRGREISRDPRHIIREITDLVQKAGIREVTLLGQNVNSYGSKDGRCDFPELLERISEIEGLERIRFTTSHPKDLSERLIKSYGRLQKLCRHIHLPVQSGSNAVLKRMNRKYTRESYLDKVHRLRETCPDIAVTSDIIVGFPGETLRDYEATLDLLTTVEFDSLFAFKYSDRQNAAAGRFPNKVAEVEKSRRLQVLLDIQSQITLSIHRRMRGEVTTVLVEGFSRKHGENPDSGARLEWSGRTSANKIVNFVQDAGPPQNAAFNVGDLVAVRIEKAGPHSLWGRTVESRFACARLKGDKSYAA
jgi:tRNA-2-methylthio-N6-dimethylallyladenosine synthase